MVVDYIFETYGIKPEYPWASYPDYATFKEKLSGKWFALILNVRREQLGLPGKDRLELLNVKAEPEMIGLLSGTPGYRAGYHMNKRYWLSIFLDGSVDTERIFRLIDNSYTLISDTPTVRIYRAVSRIPRGRVATYGQIAEMAGDPKMARAVGNALHKNPDPESIPCYRVVNAKGELSGEFAFGGARAQEKLLRADGIEFDGKNRVVLERFQLRPEDL